jgi:hypothetical protein
VNIKAIEIFSVKKQQISQLDIFYNLSYDNLILRKQQGLPPPYCNYQRRQPANQN